LIKKQTVKGEHSDIKKVRFLEEGIEEAKNLNLGFTKDFFMF
jgi:hypothetical protein